MSHDKINCKSIRQLIAVTQPLSPAQLKHVKSCQQCATLKARLQQLDRVVTQATMDLVPAGFSERLMARLPPETATPIQSCTPISDKLLATFSHSRLLRTIAISLGMALGIGQLVQFILGIFFVSMMAAM